jgi:hypothetical protein
VNHISIDIFAQNQSNMKGLLSFSVIALVLIGCGTQKNLGKSYGPSKVDVSKAISVEEMIQDYASKSGRVEYTFEAELNEVCSKAGCWVNIDKGNGDTFMVRFKDHFTIPPSTEVGTGAYLHGWMYRDTVSVDMLRHFAEDAGKSQEEIESITESKYTLGFEADAITLKK